MDIVLIKLIIAHLIGDFFLQPNSWVKDKTEKKLKSSKLYLHVLVHVILIFVLFFNFQVWKMALLIGFFHLLIDACKSIFQTSKNARMLFFIDQGLHFLVIVGIWLLFTDINVKITFLNNINFWILLTGTAFLSVPTAIIMKVIIAKWLPTEQATGRTSLQNAGKYIGVLERLLIFLFILTNHFEAVGFLLAAKSIFRFGDLKDAHDIKLTEYVLIGTLLSFGIAIATALFSQYLIA
ncbi:DUF3307 domain-containing protein [Pedobacter sp. MW01-1-1]|uniref:DUF3307 domain-containing protein n=1 Tax=Pedobacter sp. MW01-1-1 TaxID=3383027 RepID=UPI003FEEFFDF